nr:hypothetical protein [Tanacetum cinerariifolium]
GRGRWPRAAAARPKAAPESGPCEHSGPLGRGRPGRACGARHRPRPCGRAAVAPRYRAPKAAGPHHRHKLAAVDGQVDLAERHGFDGFSLVHLLDIGEADDRGGGGILH